MRTIVAWTLTLTVGAWTLGSAPAQQPQAGQAPRKTAAQAPAKVAAAPAPVDPQTVKARQAAEAQARAEMNGILELWERQSKQTTSLNVALEKVEFVPGFGVEYFRGRAMLQSPDLACLEFTKCKLDANGNPATVADKNGRQVPAVNPEPTERIVCTGNEILQYSWEDRKIIVFPLDKQVRQKALQQGPLPFLFNMKAADAKMRYSMTLLKQDENEYLIGIVPNEEIDQESFTRAFLWLNKKTYLPNKLWLLPDDDPKKRVEYKFVGPFNTVVANVPMDKSIFGFARLKDWKVLVNPDQGGKANRPNPAPAAGQDAMAPRRQAVQPSAKPAGRPQ